LSPDCAVEPMMTLWYHVRDMALNGTTRPGRQVLDLTAGHIPVARPSAITGARAQLSFDDGLHWQNAQMTRLGPNARKLRGLPLSVHTGRARRQDLVIVGRNDQYLVVAAHDNDRSPECLNLRFRQFLTEWAARCGPPPGTLLHHRRLSATRQLPPSHIPPEAL
jgi:hypothetical protein